MFAEILCKSFGEQSDIVSFIAHQMFTKVENFDLKKALMRIVEQIIYSVKLL